MKKAFKGVAELKGLKSVNSYHKISNSEVFDWMMDNRSGRVWISEARIRIVRRTLPKMYREKK